MSARIITINQNAAELTTIKALVNDWLEEGKLEGLADKSIERYTDTLAKFQTWLAEFHPEIKHPRDVKLETAKEFLTYLRTTQKVRWGLPVKPGKEKLGQVSIQIYAGQTSSFFGWLEQNGYIESNPFRHQSLKISATRSRKQSSITSVEDVPEDQLKTLLALINSKEYIAGYAGCRNRAIIMLLLDSGMRRGELFINAGKRLELGGS
jgi:integrase